ncbi:PEP-CTERM sorting domain-containing protein [Roseateles sp. BYS87W]|uniref:PEP-CTERM sorting domain-containing protein n=1 Tax=Pelomonas baiyunensis TaxID=3299026 RepID=A0ABW7H4F2_9BURK
MQFGKFLAVQAATAVAALTLASSTVAAPVIDQANDVIGGVAFNGGNPSLTWQQSVTAGISGKLTAIAFNFSASDQLSKGTTVFVNLGSGWQADTNDFFAKLNTLSVGWNVIDVSSAGIMLNAGDQFMIGLTGINADSFDPSFSGTAGDEYTDGAVYLNGQQFAAADYDINFRTYVDAGGQQLPEPTSVALAGLALLGAGVARRRAKV